MNEQNTNPGESATQPVASFQAYGSQGPAQAFMSALQAMEKDGNVNQIAARFAPSCQLWRQSYAEAYHDAEGVQKFWAEYLKQFESIATDFTNVRERENLAILEWESRGNLQGGRPIHYRGVSILELGDEGKVSSFKTYFDSAHFISVHAGAGETATH